MADNYLERHYDEWLKKKAAWEKKGKPKPKQPLCKDGECSVSTPTQNTHY